MNIVIGATGWQAQEAAPARRGGGARNRRCRRAEFRDWREPVPGVDRARRGVVARPAGVRRLAARAASRGEARCTVGDGAGDRSGDARAGLRASDRRGVVARRVDSGHAHGRVRRGRRDDHADAHGARSHGLRARRAAGGALAARPAWMVHDAGRAGGRETVAGSGRGSRVRELRVRTRDARLRSFGRKRSCVEQAHASGRRCTACTSVKAVTGYRGDHMRRLWTGCGTALVTPFTRDGAVDEAGVRRLARRQIDAGMHFLVPCGTTGESPTLSEEERFRVVAAGGRGGRRPRARARRRRRLRHARGDSDRAEDEAARRRRHPVGDAVLQQADAGRPVPALLPRSPARSGCRSSSTTCRAAPAATSTSPRSRA